MSERRLVRELVYGKAYSGRRPSKWVSEVYGEFEFDGKPYVIIGNPGFYCPSCVPAARVVDA